MATWERNVEAYHIMADMLVNLRKIIHRGLEKVAGKTWYREACPAQVFDRLVLFKENEAAIDRFTRDYQELISFATFRDLAEILDANEELQVLLETLDPEGCKLIDRIRELERYRHKLAAAIPFEYAEIEIIAGFHQEFRTALRRRRGAGEETVPATIGTVEKKRQAEAEPEIEPSDEEIDSAAADVPSEEEAAALETADVGGRAGLDEPPAGEEPTAEDDTVPARKPPITVASEFIEGAEIDVDALFDDEPAVTSAGPTFEGSDLVEGLEEEFEAEEKERTDKGTKTDPYRPTSPEGPSSFAPTRDLSADVERAIADGNDIGVLRALHAEVTWVAEGIFANDADRPHAVWEALRAQGWYDMKLGEFGLAPLELFYAVADEARAKIVAGADSDEIKEFLTDAHFTKLLLSMRDMFMRQRL